MGDEKYNGWANYPTWCVNLWLGNDEGIYDATLELTEVGVQAAEHDERRKYWSVEEARRYIVADMLKAWVEDDLAPDLGASFAADLLGYALGEVDWYEIADAWIESVRENVAG